MSNDDMTIKSLQRIEAARTMRTAINALRDVLDDDDSLDFLCYDDHRALIMTVEIIESARNGVRRDLDAVGRRIRS